MKSDVTQAFDDNISKQRLDFQRLPNGGVRALLSVTLPGGMTLVFPADVSPAAANAVAGLYDAGGSVGATSADQLSEAQAWARIALSWRDLKFDPANKRPKGWKYDAPRTAQQKWWVALPSDKRKAYKIRFAAIADNAPSSARTDDARNQWWRGLSKDQRTKLRDPYTSDFFESVANAAKEVASSEVFKGAAKGLAMVAPALGPFAPAAMAVSAGMGTASTLLSARTAAKRGNKAAAAALTQRAVSDAKRIAPKQAAKLLKIAQDKSRAASELASRPSNGKAKPAAALPAKRTASAPRALPASAGTVSAAQLVSAAKRGNVYVLHAG